MIKLGIIMDPIDSINIKKDSSFAMLLEAQNRGYNLYYMELSSLYIRHGECRASTKLLSVTHNYDNWYSFKGDLDIFLGSLDVILMRKDPPFDMEFIYATYILEQAESHGTIVVNKPQSLRDCNEKLFASWFHNHTPHTILTRNEGQIRTFLKEHHDIILKPLDAMGGKSVFRIKKDDPNISVIIESITNYGHKFCIAQNFLEAIKDGDKRVLVVDGEPVPYCLARIPQHGETRGNLAAGGLGVARHISETDWKIASDVAPMLKQKDLIFVGLDIIGDRLTEINITSPTCIVEIEAAFNISITSMLLDAIEKRIFYIKGN